MKHVIVASHNPVKIEAANLGFAALFPAEDFHFAGVNVPSLVSDQPQSDAETLQGAHNRAEHARQHSPQADYWVGIEGGIADLGHAMQAFAWVVIRNHQHSGQGKTGTFILPQEVARLVREGHELGDADDIVFGKSNSKQQNGAIGLLTGDVLTRATFYQQAVIMALIPFKNPQLTF